MHGLAVAVRIAFARTCWVFVAFAALSHQESSDVPMFGGVLNNITVSVTRDASLTCVVENLSTYKVAWLRVDTQTILTIAGHVITKNHRIQVTHSDQRSWTLHIREVRETDQGWYMCQLNTDPMKSQTAFVHVVVPPDILDSPTSTDMAVREGGDVTLRCAATGSPLPSVAWRREAGRPISLGNGTVGTTVEGAALTIRNVSRQDMGAYLCIASNGVPPTVSKRILLIVHFSPNIWVRKQLVGALENHPASLECHAEAFPKPISYWTRDHGEILTTGSRYQPIVEESSYKVSMRIVINNVTSKDFGTYRCVCKNSLGDTEGTIKLYKVPLSSVISRSATFHTSSDNSVFELSDSWGADYNELHKQMFHGLYMNNNVGKYTETVLPLVAEFQAQAHISPSSNHLIYRTASQRGGSGSSLTHALPWLIAISLTFWTN